MLLLDELKNEYPIAFHGIDEEYYLKLERNQLKKCFIDSLYNVGQYQNEEHYYMTNYENNKSLE